MNSLRRVLFYGGIAVLWLLALGVALEAWPRLQGRIVERSNPFLLSREQELPWPSSDPQKDAFAPFLLDDDLRARLRGRGKSVAPLAPVSPQQEMAVRASAFLEYDTPERYLFANVFGLHVFLLRRDGTLPVSYSVQNYDGNDRLSSLVSAADERLILEAMAHQSAWESNACFVSDADGACPGSFGYCLLVPEISVDPQDAWLMFCRSESRAAVPQDSLWELPFVSYKKQVVRHERINVLGITEDYYINNYGFRDWDVILPKPEGVFRIVCIGASTTEEGITNELTYPAILEAMINSHYDANSVDVINCGISGMNSMKHRMRLPDYLALAPDMIFLYAAVNDICHQLIPGFVAQATPRQQHARRSRFITQYMNRLLLPSDEEIQQAIAAQITPHLRYMVRQAAAQGVASAICSFAAPSPELLSREEYAYYNYLTMKEWGGRYVTFDSYLRVLRLYNASLRQLCAEEGVQYIPVAEELRGGASIFGDICHMRNPGIQQKAGIMAEALIPKITSAISTAP